MLLLCETAKHLRLYQVSACRYLVVIYTHSLRKQRCDPVQTTNLTDWISLQRADNRGTSTWPGQNLTCRCSSTRPRAGISAQTGEAVALQPPGSGYVTPWSLGSHCRRQITFTELESINLVFVPIEKAAKAKRCLVQTQFNDRAYTAFFLSEQQALILSKDQ